MVLLRASVMTAVSDCFPDADGQQESPHPRGPMRERHSIVSVRAFRVRGTAFNLVAEPPSDSKHTGTGRGMGKPSQFVSSFTPIFPVRDSISSADL